MIFVTRHGLIVRGSDADFAAGRQLFATQHCLRLEGFIEEDLLRTIRRSLRTAPFHDRTHDGIGTELCLSEGPLSAGLEFLWNAPMLSAALDRLTECGPFGCFEGREVPAGVTTIDPTLPEDRAPIRRLSRTRR